MPHPEPRSPAEMFDRFFGPALFTPGADLLLRHAGPHPGERVLDLACGTGTVARAVAPLVAPEGHVVGLDLNPGMLHVARSRPAPGGATIEWREGDAAHLDLADDSFDLVLCQQGLQFFPDRARAAREMRRVLRSGGRVALNLWQALERHPVYQALLEAEARYLGLPLEEVASPFTFPDAGRLHALLTEAGFEGVEVIPESMGVHFPSPDRFVYLTLFAAAAFMPDFAWDDEATRTSLIGTVSREIEPVLERYRDGERLSFPAFWHVAVATKA